MPSPAGSGCVLPRAHGGGLRDLRRSGHDHRVPWSTTATWAWCRSAHAGRRHHAHSRRARRAAAATGRAPPSPVGSILRRRTVSAGGWPSPRSTSSGRVEVATSKTSAIGRFISRASATRCWSCRLHEFVVERWRFSISRSRRWGCARSIRARPLDGRRGRGRRPSTCSFRRRAVAKFVQMASRTRFERRTQLAVRGGRNGQAFCCGGRCSPENRPVHGWCRRRHVPRVGGWIWPAAPPGRWRC